MKKHIPFDLRQELDKVERKYPGLFKVEIRLSSTTASKPAILLKEKNDPDSPFRFRIIGFTSPYRVLYNPADQESTAVATVESLPLHEIVEVIDHWAGLLEIYNSPSPMFDDPIIQSYYEEIESKFQILDEDAKTAPYKFSQQKALMQIFENIKKEVDLAKKGDDDEEATAILNEIATAQENLGKETKWKVVERLRKIVAMCMQHGYDLGVKVLETAAITEILRLVGM